TMKAAFGVPVGLSDHSLGVHIAPAAVALGADLVEKHFTLDRSMPGPDHSFAVEPAELRDLVAHIRDVEVALGDGRKHGPTAAEPARADLLVIDSYRYRADDRQLYEGRLVAGVDDICRDLAVSVVVDPCPGATAAAHHAAGRVLAGSSFALLPRPRASFRPAS